MGEIIYHYTSIETLYAILNDVREDSIYLNLHCISNMNDMYEGHAGLTLSKTYLSKISGSYTSVQKDFKKSIGSIEKIEKDKKDEKSDTTNGEYGIFDKVFAMSFSEVSDNLSQWRAYGDNAKGVCIGFDFDILKNLDGIKDNQNSRMHKVDYIQPTNENFEYIRDLINKIEEEKIESIKSLNKYVAGAMCFFKDDTFKDEEEYRLMYNNVEELPKNWEKEFKFSNGKIVNYIKVKLPKNSIRSIMLGPTEACKQDKNVLEDYLVKQNFVDTEIVISFSPNDKAVTIKESKKIALDVEQSKIPYIPK